MADAKQPNILVIWGDDIGITNLSAYSDGLMGYRTPNIDRIADEGMRFTDSYGEQSCTAGRSSFITGQSVFRTGLSKVGVPGADVGLQSEDVTIAELLKPLGYATGQFGKNHLGDLNKFLPTVHGFDEFFGNLYHLNAEEEPETPNWPPAEDFPGFNERFRPRGVLHAWATDSRRRHRGRPLRPRRPPADRGHGAADEEADGDDRRRGARARARLRRPPGRGRHAVLLLVQHDPHALPHAPEAGEHRAGGALAVALPRHDDRPRQGRRRAAGQARRARPRRGHDRRLQHRQRAAHEHVARRRHDAVPQREEHQLGGRVPRPGDGPLAGQDPRGRRLERDRPAPRLAADVPRRRRRARHRREAQGRAHDRRHDLQGPHRRLQPAALPDRRGRRVAAQGDGLLLRRRRRARAALRQLEGRLHGAARAGHAADLGRAVRRAARAQALQPAHWTRSSAPTSRRTRTTTGWSRATTSCSPRPRSSRSSSRRSRSSRRARRRRASRSTRWSRSSRAR